MPVTEFTRPSSRPGVTSADRRGFRTDVQALRAIAVGGVVLYHLWPEQLRGGFVGVDVFYVISGYLITQHLVKELVSTGRIAVTKFWARRIRRLLPVAFTVLAVSAALLLLVMPPVTWSENLTEIAAAALYVENWVLGFHAVDYLAASDSASIVQHYWSLSVEEQFYIVWPLVLVGTVLLARRRGHGDAVRTATITLAAITLVSLVVSVVLTARSPAFAFFATPTRAWEFGLGGLVALVGAPAFLRRPVVDQLLTWGGFALIAASMLIISKDVPFPGAIALLPTVGTAMVLRGGVSDGRFSAARLSGWRPVQWIGDQSYSIYLWHWPLIIALPWALREPLGWRWKLAILTATLLLAALSKRFVEDPIRTRRSWAVRRRPNYVFVVTAMVVTVAFVAGSLLVVQGRDRAVAAGYASQAAADPDCFGAAALHDVASCSDAFTKPSAQQIAYAATDLGPSQHCQMDRPVTTLTLCSFGRTKNPTRTVVVVGNSHALRIVPALEAYGKSRGWRIILAAKTDCMGLSTTPVGTQSADAPCLVWSRKVQAYVQRSHPDLVLFASHEGAQVYLAGSNATPAEVAEASRNVVASWSGYVRAGIPVLVTGDVPGMRPQSDPECVARSQATTDPCWTARSSAVKPNLMTELAQANPSLVSYQSLTSQFCDATRCHGVIGGVVVYSDSHHMTDTFSRTLGPVLGRAVDRAIAG